MTEKAYDKGAQTREAHAAYNFEQIYPWQMLDRIPKQGIVMDIGTGVGRDAVAMHDRANGRLLVIGIDPDEANYHKAVETYPDKDIVLCREWADVAKVKRNRQIAYLVREVQNLETPPSKLKADFINCSAVMMFIPEEEQGIFLKKLHALSKPYHDIFMRFRTDMLKEGMTAIHMQTFFNYCQMADFFTEVLPRFPDPPPSERDFSWHDRILTATEKSPSSAP